MYVFAEYDLVYEQSAGDAPEDNTYVESDNPAYPEAEYPYTAYPNYAPEDEPTTYDEPQPYAAMTPLSGDGYITVFITFEGFNLGHGFYVEPTAVTVPIGATAAYATLALQDMHPNLGRVPNWVSHRGGTGSGFYMEGILGFNRDYVNLPSYLTTPEMGWFAGMFNFGDAIAGGDLLEFTFTFMSGWMITVNNVLISESAGAFMLNDGDVIRWQFTVYGLGADVGIDSGWGNIPPFIMHDRTDLIRALFNPNAAQSARQNALDVIINPLATTEEIAAAHDALISGTAATPVNRGYLLAAIESAQERTEADYTAESWQVLQSALLSAVNINDDTNATQTQIDETTTTLTAAITALIPYVQATTWQTAMARGLDYIVSTVTTPHFGSVGGEWAVLALARAGHPVPDGYFETYIHQIGERLMNIGITTDPNSTQNAGGRYPLNRIYNPATGKYEVRLGNQAQSTENSRLILALTSLGIDASNFTHNGVTFDLVAQYGQRNNATSNQMWGELQGINGPIFNLIALNSRGWDAPYEISDRTWVGGTTTSNPITLDQRIEWVLNVQLSNGGWTLSHFNAANTNTVNLPSDPDMTAMAIQALAPYTHMPAIAAAIDRALTELARTQLPNGGWTSMGNDNVQSPGQVIVALTKLGIDPTTDPRFTTANGSNPVSTLLRFFDPITGGFFHPQVSAAGGAVNLMASEQAVYSLVAYWRFVQGMNSLYNMSDAFAPPQAPVDRTALNAIITSAQARTAANYTSATWSAMQTELAAAILVRDNTNATQADVDAVVGRLNTAVNALAFVQHINFTMLDNAIASAAARVQSNYTPESWARMQTALDIARQVRNDINASQVAVNTAANNLADAEDALVEIGSLGPGGPRVSLVVYNPNVRSGDPIYFLQGGTVRQMYIYINYPYETAYSILRRPELGLSIHSSGHHTWAGMYVEAINNFGEFDGGPLSGWMFAVNRVFPARSASLVNLRDGDRLYWLYTYELGSDIIPGFGVYEGDGLGVNRTALRAAIRLAEQRIQTNYTTESWAQFQTALNAARHAYNNPAATQGEINTAESDLSAAYDGLVESDQSEGFPGTWVGDYLEDEYDEVYEEEIPDPEATLDEYMLADGEAVASVVYDLIQQAIDTGATGVIFFVPTISGRTELGFNVSTLREAAAAGLSLTIRSDIAAITLDVATLAGIAYGMDDEALVHIIADMYNVQANAPQQEAIGNNRAIKLTIMVGNTLISNFEGIITIVISYTPSVTAQDHDLLTVYHVDIYGNTNEMAGARYEGSNITFTTSHFSIFFISEWISPFIDVSHNAWYFRSVRFAYANGLMIGTGPEQFSPNTNLSRAMMVTLLWRMAGMPAVASTNSFCDVADGRWYSDAIAWAKESNIVNGHDDGTFAPQENMTREQLALIFKNFSSFNGTHVFADTFASEFADADSISPWALNAMMWANTNGLINGRTMSTLVPGGTATRAEVAEIIQRFIEM